jgi:hypothetical protein
LSLTSAVQSLLKRVSRKLPIILLAPRRQVRRPFGFDPGLALVAPKKILPFRRINTQEVIRSVAERVVSIPRMLLRETEDVTVAALRED